MALRICFVTPFSWSQPHDVNEHVRGAAAALRRRGHTVTVRRALVTRRRPARRAGAPCSAARSRTSSRSARPSRPRCSERGRRCRWASAPTSPPRSRRGAFDVVHGFEPGLPSLSYVALLEAETTTAATFFSTERLAIPPRKNQRDEAARPGRRARSRTSEAAVERGRRAVPGRLPDDPARGRHRASSRPAREAEADRRRAGARAERRSPARCCALLRDAARLGGRARSARRR